MKRLSSNGSDTAFLSAKSDIFYDCNDKEPFQHDSAQLAESNKSMARPNEDQLIF